MNNFASKYVVINKFALKTEEERKRQINQIIKKLCVVDIEKNTEKEYNLDVAFHGSVSDLKKGGTQ